MLTRDKCYSSLGPGHTFWNACRARILGGPRFQFLGRVAPSPGPPPLWQIRTRALRGEALSKPTKNSEPSKPDYTVYTITDNYNHIAIDIPLQVVSCDDEDNLYATGYILSRTGKNYDIDDYVISGCGNSIEGRNPSGGAPKAVFRPWGKIFRKLLREWKRVIYTR